VHYNNFISFFTSNWTMSDEKPVTITKRKSTAVATCAGNLTCIVHYTQSKDTEIQELSDISLIPFRMQCGYGRCSLLSATAWMTYAGQCQSTLIPLITVSTAGAIVLSPTFPGPSPPSRNDPPTSPATVKGQRLVSERRLESKVYAYEVMPAVPRRSIRGSIVPTRSIVYLVVRSLQHAFIACNFCIFLLLSATLL